MQMRPATRGSERIASARASPLYVRQGCAQGSCNSSVVTSHETSCATAVSKTGRCRSSHAAVRASPSRAAIRDATETASAAGESRRFAGTRKRSQPIARR
jgi:hypothetical protein